MKTTLVCIALCALGCARDPLGLAGHYRGTSTTDWRAVDDTTTTRTTIEREGAALDVEPGSTADAVVAGLPTTLAAGALSFACTVPLVIDDGELVLAEEFLCDTSSEQTADGARRTYEALWTLTALRAARGTEPGTLEVFGAVAADLTATEGADPPSTGRLEGAFSFRGAQVASEAR